MAESYPDVNDFVVCKVKAIKDYGAFVDLMEYPFEGFVHISNIASGWVKNIRSHVSENQVRVAVVVRVDTQKKLIDLSLRRVSPNQEKAKLVQWKNQKRAEKLFERCAGELKVPFDKAMKEIAPKLVEEYGQLYEAFEVACLDGEASLKKCGVPANWCKVITKMARDTIKPPHVSIRANVQMSFSDSNGVEHIKKIAKDVCTDDVDFSYVSAPNYSLIVESKDYPAAEKIMGKVLDKIKNSVAQAKGTFSFKRP